METLVLLTPPSNFPFAVSLVREGDLLGEHDGAPQCMASGNEQRRFNELVPRSLFFGFVESLLETMTPKPEGVRKLLGPSRSDVITY